MGIFEIFEDNGGKFRWRLKAPHGETVATSEAYLSKRGCQNGIDGVKQFAPDAQMVDLTLLKSGN